MTRAGALALVALCSCGIDARTVEVSPACASPPTDGLLSDFSTARLGFCYGAPCPDDSARSTTVSLGTGGVTGLVFPFERRAHDVLALGLTGDLHRASDETSALRVVMSYDSMTGAIPAEAGAFALALPPSLCVSSFTALAFQTAGSLGTCPLRVVPLFRDPTAATPDATCPLDDCRPAAGVVVGPGLDTVPLAVPAGAESPASLVGVAWRFGLPGDGGGTCNADFTIDDLRLIAAPP